MSDVSKINGYNLKDTYSREQLADLGEKIIGVMEDVGILKNYKDQNGIDVEALKQLTSTLQESLDEANTLVEEIEKELANTKEIANNAHDVAKGKNQSLAFEDYGDMWNHFCHGAEPHQYQRGQNIYIGTVDVPDLWIYEACDNHVYYEFLSGDDVADDIKKDGVIQIGYYKLAPLETQKVDLGGYAKYVDLQSTWDEINLKQNKSDFVVIEKTLEFDLGDYTQGTYTHDIPSTELPNPLRGGNKLDNYVIISAMVHDGEGFVGMSSYDEKEGKAYPCNFSVSLLTAATGTPDEKIRIKLRNLYYGSDGFVFTIPIKIVLMKIS